MARSLSVTVERDANALWLWTLDGMAIPSGFTAWVDDPTLDYVVQLVISAGRASTGGTVEVDALAVVRRTDRVPFGPEITARAIKTLPVGRLRDQAIAAARRKPTRMADGKHFTVDGVTVDAFGGPGVRRRYRRDDLNAVADVYRTALRDGRPTHKAIKDAFKVENPGRLIQRAREAGHLGPAPSNRKKGELP